MRGHVSRSALVLGAGCLAAALVAPPAPVRGQGAQWDDALAASLAGAWALAISPEAAQAVIERGIATAVADLPPLVDGAAASQLRARLIVARTVDLSVAPDRIEVRYPHASYASAPGATVSVPEPGDASRSMQVVQLVRAGRLEQIFTTERGRRWITFTVSPDGSRLALDTVVHSERLPTDVRFQLPYRRAR